MRVRAKHIKCNYCTKGLTAIVKIPYLNLSLCNTITNLL